QIEPRHPADHPQTEQDRSKIDLPRLGDPGADRGEGQGKSKKEMSGRGETFRDRIEKDGGQSQRRKPEGQPVNGARASDKSEGAEGERGDYGLLRKKEMS